MIDYEYVNKIASYYETNHSLADTAYIFHISSSKCRKILITQGVYQGRGKKVKEILLLYAKGYNIEQIAEQVGASEGYIKSVIPYDKGIYNLKNKTKNAKRIEKCRKQRL